MHRLPRILLGIVLWAALAAAQIVPGRYVVELNTEPLGAAVRSQGRAALHSRVSNIHAEQAQVKAQVERRGGHVLSTTDSLMNTLIVRIPDEQADALALIPGVKKVYPVHEVQLNLDHALAIHQVPAAWARIGGKDHAGAGIKIAILDTGVSPDHPGFQDPTLKPPPGFPLASKPENLAFTNNKIIVARSYEDIYQETDPDDARDHFGHGTAVAMCAAGVTNKGPYATITGVAPKAWIGGYKIVAGNSGSASGDVILKAMDDALGDGMDVINLSFGSPFPFATGPDFLPATALERLSRFGVIVVVSAGNSGPGSNTLGDYAASPYVIAAGATQNDRSLNGSVSLAGGAPYQAFPSTGTGSASAISSTVFDVASVDPTGFGCSPLPAGSAAGQIVLILRGVCTFEQKINDAAAGGAVAAILYTDATRPDAIFPASGSATLPAVLLSYADGTAVKNAVATNPSITASIVFGGISFPQDSMRLASFTSKGPNYDYTIKPDVAAVGTNIYTAAESIDDQGQIYSKDGYTQVDGTSFASPIVAGAAALVRGARPGLTVDQYRSLLINGASPMIRADGWVERVQQVGSGLLNVDTALVNTVTAFPTSLTYLTGTGTLGGSATGDYDQLTLTNVGKTAETYNISALSYDQSPPLQFGQNSAESSPTSTLALTINPGQSKTIYAFWTTTSRLPGGEYQGQIIVQGTHDATSANIPYWYGVPTGIPRAIFQLNGTPASAPVGSTVNVIVRVTDEIGVPITDNATLAFRGQVVAGGGTITLSPSVFFSGLRQVQLKMGPNPTVNTFVLAFANLPPLTISITGTRPAP